LGKIIISLDGMVEQTVQLSKERMTIGRRSRNDIVLTHPAVSGEHGAITTIGDESFLEDLQSTNGTYVNGHRIGKHFLQHQDVIRLAKYQIEYQADGIRPAAAAAAEVASTITPPRPAPAVGRIEVLNGSNAGKQLALTKAQTTLGRAGVQVVVISLGADGYSVAHVDGDAVTLLNGTRLDKQPQRLKTGDVLDLSGTQMTFRQD
jgi:predicted component of type VI protein secretion system